jgi:hypothetical protein
MSESRQLGRWGWGREVCDASDAVMMQCKCVVDADVRKSIRD